MMRANRSLLNQEITLITKHNIQSIDRFLQVLVRPVCYDVIIIRSRVPVYVL